MYTSTMYRLLVFVVMTSVICLIPFSISSQPSSIGDFVWYDANNNGIQETGEPGYENTRVWMYTEFVPGSYTLVGQTLTDASGIYQFDSFNAFIQSGRTYYIVVVDELNEPGSTNPTVLTLQDVGSDLTDSDASIAAASFTAFAGFPYIEYVMPATTTAVANLDFGFFTQCDNLQVSLPASIMACYGETLDLVAITSGGNGQLGYDWTDGSSSLSNMNSVRIFASQTYGVTVTDEVGCTNSAEIAITVGDCPMDLSLTKSHTGANAYFPGDLMTFNIEVCNEGQAVVDSIVLFDYLPVGYILMDNDWQIIAANTTVVTAAIELGASTGTLPSTGLLIGDCITIPMDVQIDECANTTNLENIALIQYQLDAYGQSVDSDSTPSADIIDEDDTDSDMAPVFDLALRKTLATPSFPYKINEVVVFDIEVFNQGNVPATEVEVIDHIPAGFVFTSGPNTGWNYNMGTGQAIYTIPGTILPGESAVVSISLLVGSGSTVDDWTNNAEILSAKDSNGNDMSDFDIDSTPDDNPTNDIGGVAGSDSDNVIDDNGQNKDGDNVTDEDDQDTEMILVFDLALKKELSTSAPYYYGQDHLFNITICNQGNIVATDIVVEDFIPNGYSVNSASSMPLWSMVNNGSIVSTTMGQLAPGTCDVIPLTLTLNQTSGSLSDWVNYAEIISAKDNLGVDMTDNDMDSTPGSNSTQENAVLPGDADDDNLNGNGPTVGEDEDDHDPAAPMIYDVALSKTLVSTGPFAYGDVVIFNINVYNQGNEILSGVDVYDIVPSGFTYLNTNDPTWTYTNATREAFTTITNLMPGQSQTITLALEVNASIGDEDAWTNFAEVANIRNKNGDNVNDLEVDSTPNMDPTDDIGGTPDTPEDDEINDNGTDLDGDGVTDEDDSDVERIEIFDLALKKETFTPGPYMYYQDVTFNITIENQGNTNARDIEIIDYIPAGYTINTALSTGWSAAGEYTIASTLLPGESIVVPIVLIVQPYIGDAQAWNNYAEIIAARDNNGVSRANEDADSTPGSNSATENSVLPNGVDDDNILGNGPNVGEDEDDHDPANIEIFDLSLTKTTSDLGPYKINDIVTYDIEICNQGNINPSVINVLDYLADGLTFVNTNVPTWTTIAVPNAAITSINGLAPNECVTRSIELRVSKSYDDEDGWTNRAEISAAFNDINVMLTDADSTMDNDQDNDAGGTPETSEDDHVLDDGKDSNGDGITDEDDSDPARLKIFDLALDKNLVTVGPYIYGQLIQFDIRVYNQGNEDVTQVNIADYYASGYSFNVADNPGWNASAQYEITQTITPNTFVTVPVFLTLEQTVGNDEDWYNYSEIISFSDINGTDVSDRDVDSTPNSNTAVENAVIPLGPNDNNILGCGPILGEDEDDHDPAGIRFYDAALRKTLLTTGPVHYGDVVSFEIEVFNQGSEEFDVEIVDYIPEGFVYVATNSPVWTLDAMTNYAYTSLNNIEPGLTKTVTIDLQLQSFCYDSTAWTNRSEVSRIIDMNGQDVSVLDYDSKADALNGNDVGGTPRTPEDDLITDDGTDRDGDGVADEDDEDPAILDIFDLALKNELFNAGTLANGQDFVFNIIVENQGNVTATNIVIADYVPAGFIFDVANNPGWTAAATYNITGPLYAEQKDTIPLVLTYFQTTGGMVDYTTYAEIISSQDINGIDNTNDDVDSTPGSDTATERSVQPLDEDDDNVKGNGPLAGEDEDDHDPAGLLIFDGALRKTVLTEAPYRKGDVVTFQIEVFNQGDQSIHDVLITDYYAMGLEYVATNNITWTPDVVNDWATTVIPEILPGESSIVTIDYLLIANTDQTGWTNIAEISQMFNENGIDVSLLDIDSTPDQVKNNDIGGTPLTGEDDEIDDDGTDFDMDGITDEDDSDPAFLPIYDAALTIEVVTPDPYTYKQLIQYDITVHNQGNVELSNVVIEDYLPVGLSFDVANNPGWNAAGTYMIPTVVPSWTSVTFPVYLSVEQTMGGSRNWLNYAEVVSFADVNGVDQSNNDYDSNLASNSAYENLVEEGDKFDDNIFGCGEAANEDEDDHDPAGIIVQDLAIKKEIVTQGPYTFGQPVTYRMTVYNQGNDIAYNTTLSDYVPVGLGFDPVNNAAWYLDANTSKATTTLSTPIVAGESQVIDIVLNINKLKNDEDAWDNRVEVSAAFDQYGAAFDDIDSELDNILGNDVGGTPWTIEDNHVADDKVDGNMDNITDEDDEDVARIVLFDLALTNVLDTPTPHVYDQVLDYTITVYNQGNEEATMISILDHLPLGMVFDPSINSGWTQLGNGDLEYTFPNPLAPVTSVSVPLSLQIIRTDGGVKHWTHYAEIKTASGRTDIGSPNRDQWDIDSTPDSDSAYEHNVCIPPYNSPDDLMYPWDDNIDGCGPTYGEDEDDHDPAGIEIFDLAQIKTTTDNGPFRYGDMILYTISIFNQGSLNSSNIEITDYIPCGFELVSAQNTGWAHSGDYITTTSTSTLLPGASIDIPLTLMVVPCIDNSEIAWTNYTEISDADTEDLFATDDFDSTMDQVNGETNIYDNETQNPLDEDDHDIKHIHVMDFALKKTTPICDPFLLGDTIRFDVTVYNQGNIMNGDIGIIDTIHSGFIYDAILNPGWIVNGNIADYTIPANSIAPEDSVVVPMFLVLTMDSDPHLEDYWNRSEISFSSDINGNTVDADSNADRNFYNDNAVMPIDTIANIFDINDDEVRDNFPVFGDPSMGNDDEDDSDPAKISAASRIADFTWKDVDGNGLQDVNEPGAENVQVYLKDCDGNIIDYTLSDAEGFYEFIDIQPGFYFVDFDIDLLPPGCEFTFPNVGNDDTVDSDVDLEGLIPCRPIAGMQDSTIDAGLLYLASIGDYVWEDINGDGIQDSNEPGIAGIQVKLVDANGYILQTVQTDATGYYLIEDIYPGNYFLQFKPKDGYEFTFSNAGVNGAKDSNVDGSNGLNTTPYTFLESGEDDLDWDAGMYRCVKIGERVWYDTNEDDLRGDTENGINGITINLYRQGTDGEFRLFESLLTAHKPGNPSDDGYYKFCTHPGTYYIEAVLPPYGLVPAYPNVGNDDTIDSDATNYYGLGTTNSFTLLSGQEMCTLGHGYYPMAQVSGRVWSDTNADGLRDEATENTIDGITVEAYNEEGVMSGSAVTDEEGNYTVDYLGKNAYYLKFVTPDGYAPTVANVGADDELDSEVDNSQGEFTTGMYFLEPGMELRSIDAGFVAGLLPLDLLTFDANRVEDYHNVTWTTTNETNVSHFELERSLITSNKFETLHIIQANNVSNEINKYSYQDFDISTVGQYFYRLKQIDVNGKFVYSDVINLYVDKYRNTEIVMSPNPAVNEVFLEFSLDTDGSLTTDIFDATGKLVLRNVIQKELKAGNHSIGMDIKNLISGVYTVRIRTNGQTINKKLIVVKN